MSVATRTDRINARVDAELKRESEAVLQALGMNLSEGINVFLRRVVAVRGIPFPLVADRRELLGDEAARLEAGFQDATRRAIAHKQDAGLPVARFDETAGRPYLEHPDGRREYSIGQ
jgi:addiction module RelB/DinJ family antitoxin